MLAQGDCITGTDIQALLPRRRSGAGIELVGSADQPFTEAKKKLVVDFTRAYLTMKLAMSNGSMTQAAQSSGINLPYFSMLKKRYLSHDDKS
jgi:hypothetical protein